MFEKVLWSRRLLQTEILRIFKIQRASRFCVKFVKCPLGYLDLRVSNSKDPSSELYLIYIHLERPQLRIISHLYPTRKTPAQNYISFISNSKDPSSEIYLIYIQLERSLLRNIPHLYPTRKIPELKTLEWWL